MGTELRTIDDLDVDGSRVLLRADLDVPLAAASPGGRGAVVDDARIRRALPTIDELSRRGARLVLLGHLGARVHRRGASMGPVAERLATLTGAPVQVAPAVTGAEVRALTERLIPGQILMLENIRLSPGENANDPGLARALAQLADVYVNDAFAIAHEARASTAGVARRLPSAAGCLVERELTALSAVVDRPARPLVAILGGRNLGEMIGVIRRFFRIADVVCLGGAISLPFRAARGQNPGDSAADVADIERARLALAAARPGCAILAPGAVFQCARATAAAGTVFWAGSMDDSDLPGSARATHVVAHAVASTRAVTVVGDEASAEAIRSLGMVGQVGHVTSGGSAALTFLAGDELPGIRALLRPRASANDGSDRRLDASSVAVADRMRLSQPVGEGDITRSRAGGRRAPDS